MSETSNSNWPPPVGSTGRLEDAPPEFRAKLDSVFNMAMEHIEANKETSPEEVVLGEGSVDADSLEERLRAAGAVPLTGSPELSSVVTEEIDKGIMRKLLDDEQAGPGSAGPVGPPGVDGIKVDNASVHSMLRHLRLARGKNKSMKAKHAKRRAQKAARKLNRKKK